MNEATWYERLTELRKVAKDNPHRAGTEGLHLLEDWLFESAAKVGFRKEHGGMNEYIGYVAKRGGLSKSDAARARRFADIRNCISHRAGLLIGKPLAEELLLFLETLFRREALHAEQLMTRSPRTVQERDNLLEARDWMLQNNVSRLPVVRDGRIVGLLTNRDILTLQATRMEDDPAPTSYVIADAMGADSLEKIHFLPLQAPYEEVLAHLQQPHVAAVFVTRNGASHERLLGVITVSDILPVL